MIRTENLTKRYRRNEALHDLTLEVPRGSVFALVGPNGAGKSTAIKIVMNVIRPSAGRAEVLGADSTRLGAAELAQIGYVSENQKMPEWMRVGYFLDYCRPFYPSWDGALAAELIRQYELPLDRRLRALSRGMKLLAKELNIPMLVLYQLSRAVETRQGDHRPQLSDLRESGSIEQDADLVGFIFREEVYHRDREDLRGLAELIVAKQRNGPVGTVNLVFLHAQTKFENRAEDTGDVPEE